MKRRLGFCLSVIIGALITALVAAFFSPTKPLHERESSLKTTEVVPEKAPVLAAANTVSTAMNLVAIILPTPPPSDPLQPITQTDTKAKPTAPKPSLPKSSNTHSPIATSPKPNSPKFKPLKTKAPQPNQTPLDAATPDTESLGFDLLTQIEGASPEINIALPNDAFQRTRVANFLRRCLGVHLGKINSQGQLLVKEQGTHTNSPYVRLVQGVLISDEQHVINSWQQRDGSVVRFYPDYVDARLLGGLQKMLGRNFTAKSINSAKITGLYSLQQGALTLKNIRINDEQQSDQLLLAKPC